MTDFGPLVAKAKDGDREAFHEIFELLSDKLFAYALSHTKSREDALDITQETFIDIWAALPRFTYKGRNSFYAFIFTIIKRKLARYYKTKKTRNEVPFDESQINESYEMKINDFLGISRLITALPGKYQEVLRLRYWSALPFSMIAVYLDVTEGTAKVWHHRALKKMQSLLDKEGYEFKN